MYAPARASCERKNTAVFGNCLALLWEDRARDLKGCPPQRLQAHLLALGCLGVLKTRPLHCHGEKVLAALLPFLPRLGGLQQPDCLLQGAEIRRVLDCLLGGGSGSSSDDVPTAAAAAARASSLGELSEELELDSDEAELLVALGELGKLDGLSASSPAGSSGMSSKSCAATDACKPSHSV